MTELNQSNLQRDKYASISSLIELCGEMKLYSPMVAVCCINLDVRLISVFYKCSKSPAEGIYYNQERS